MVQLRQLLLEYDRDITVQRYGEKVLQRAARDRQLRQEKNPANIIAQIETADPTPQKQYSEWLVRQFIQGVSYEDVSTTVKANLAAFNQLKLRKRLAADQRDINRLNAQQLAAVIRSHEERFAGGSASTADEEKGKYQVVHSGPTTMVVRLMDEKAAIYFGKNTSWCTTSGAYERYAESGDLYVVIPKYPDHRYERYQLHLNDRQCKDYEDVSFKFANLVAKYPELKIAFSKIPEYAKLPVLARDDNDLKRLRDEQKKRKQERERAVDEILASLMTK